MKLFLALLLTSSILYSQNDSMYNFTLPDLKITQIENGNKVMFDFDRECDFTLQELSLIADTNIYKYRVPIADIKKITISDGNNGWRSAKVMGLVGGSIGLLTGILFSAGFQIKEPALFYFLPLMTLSGMTIGGLLGGLIGITAPYYENYDKFSNDPSIKLYQLKGIFAKQEIKKK